MSCKVFKSCIEEAESYSTDRITLLLKHLECNERFSKSKDDMDDPTNLITLLLLQPTLVWCSLAKV